jgi:hypothetical protein
MRGGQGGEAKLSSTKNMQPRIMIMVWTRASIANLYDLIGINNIPLIKRFAVRQNYVNNCGAARAFCNSYGYY